MILSGDRRELEKKAKAEGRLPPGQSLTLMTTTVQGSVNAMDVDVAGIIATGVPERDLYTLQLPLETGWPQRSSTSGGDQRWGSPTASSWRLRGRLAICRSAHSIGILRSSLAATSSE